MKGSTNDKGTTHGRAKKKSDVQAGTSPVNGAQTEGRGDKHIPSPYHLDLRSQRQTGTGTVSPGVSYHNAVFEIDPDDMILPPEDKSIKMVPLSTALVITILVLIILAIGIFIGRHVAWTH